MFLEVFRLITSAEGEKRHLAEKGRRAIDKTKAHPKKEEFLGHQMLKKSEEASVESCQHYHPHDNNDVHLKRGGSFTARNVTPSLIEITGRKKRKTDF